MNDTVSKKELEAQLKEQMAALEETKQLIAVKEASDTLMMIRNEVEHRTALCERIGNLTKAERKVYIRKVVLMYEEAFDACEDEFAEIENRKRERAKRRQTNVKSQVQTEEHTPEQVGTSYPNFANVNREKSDDVQGTNGYVQR